MLFRRRKGPPRHTFEVHPWRISFLTPCWVFDGARYHSNVLAIAGTADQYVAACMRAQISPQFNVAHYEAGHWRVLESAEWDATRATAALAAGRADMATPSVPVIDADYAEPEVVEEEW